MNDKPVGGIKPSNFINSDTAKDGTKVALHNLGCKVNSYELDVIKRELTERGFSIVPFDSPADVYVINTCTVTNIADRKSRQMIHRARSMNADALVVALGCYVDKDKGTDPDIDIALGNREKNRLADILEERFGCREEAASAAGSPEDHTRAFLKIQDGCNRFCTYCIIPYVRGRIESRPEPEVLKEAEGLAKRGYRELVLTGIHISSYGADRKENPAVALVNLIRKLSEVEGIDRIRLGSLEPMLITEEFVEPLSEIKALCPHFHLSLQSGSGSVLKRMNRRYTPKQYGQGVELLRRYFGEPAITTDIIVGFPGESSGEFEETMDFVREIGFSAVHIFKYSKRAGTPAATMEGQLTEAQKGERAGELKKETLACEEAWLRAHLDRELEVLFEEQVVIEGERYMSGHSKEYIHFCMKTNEDLTNRIMTVKGNRLEEGIILG